MATLKISGMSCGHCVEAVTKALSDIEGISDVNVDLEKNEATFNESVPVPSSIIKNAIARIGFEVVNS